jgi:hypothetical protein
MRTSKLFILFFAIWSLISTGNKSQACSMYKITVDGKTMVGCNEDAWRTISRIWFVNAKLPNEYGAAFTGSRQVGSNRTAPQSGMNEVGLAFTRLGAWYPTQENPFTDRIKITNEVAYLTDILQKCANIEEVKTYIEKYDYCLFYDHVFIYVDSSGKYLIVEPYKLIEGNNPHYVLSNFCPSITDNEQARQLVRYRNGEDFINRNQANSSLAYFTALSDTMHVSRSRNGDGTLLTSIWNTNDKFVNLYFYHNYDTTIQFNLKEELAKGDRVISIPELFPKNVDFERLISYKTPYNTPKLRILIVILAGVLMLLTFFLAIQLFTNRNARISLKAVLLISGLNMVLTAYLAVLATHQNIYYFDAPYVDYSSNFITISSYTPFLLLLSIIPFSVFIIKRIQSNKTKTWVKAILLSNNLLYLIFIGGFAYWGLYNFWN